MCGLSPGYDMLRYLRSEPEPESAPRPALFLDRDGVLNRHIVGGYVTVESEFELIDLALGAADVAQRAGAAVVVVTNQGAISRQRATESQVMIIHALLVGLLADRGLAIDGIYACPHHPFAPDPRLRDCSCRKPKPGMILAAARDLNLDLSRSVLIGDQPSDVEAALAAGIARDRTLLVGPRGDDVDSSEFTRRALR